MTGENLNISDPTSKKFIELQLIDELRYKSGLDI